MCFTQAKNLGGGEEIEQERIAVRIEREEKSRREVEEREEGGRKREKKEKGREREGPRTCSSWVKYTGNPDCTPMESTLARCWHRSPHSCPSTAPSM